MNTKSLIIIKPDAVKRKLFGEILDRFLKRDYTVTEMKMMNIPESLAKKHYAEHKERPFFDELVSFITSGPVIVFVVEGPNAVNAIRKMVGETDPQNALPGTLRGDYANSIASNLIHASDSDDSAKREIELFFG